MATGFLDPIPLRARNCSNPNLFCCFSTSFQSFRCKAAHNLVKLNFSKNFIFCERNTKYIGLYSRIVGLTYILLLRLREQLKSDWSIKRSRHNHPITVSMIRKYYNHTYLRHSLTYKTKCNILSYSFLKK